MKKYMITVYFCYMTISLSAESRWPEEFSFFTQKTQEAESDDFVHRISLMHRLCKEEMTQEELLSYIATHATQEAVCDSKIESDEMQDQKYETEKLEVQKNFFQNMKRWVILVYRSLLGGTKSMTTSS